MEFDSLIQSDSVARCEQPLVGGLNCDTPNRCTRHAIAIVAKLMQECRFPRTP